VVAVHVDILVVMPARIELAFDPPFPLDIIVRTPKNLKWRLEEGDSFLRDILPRKAVAIARRVRREVRRLLFRAALLRKKK
jgi:hypothetical protein